MIPAIILTYKRPLYLEQTIASFQQYTRRMKISKRIPLHIYQQGPDPQTELIIDKWESVITNHTIFPENIGSGPGYCKAMKDMMKRHSKAKYIMYLEDDWLMAEPIYKYMDEIIRFMDYSTEAGFIRLRNVSERVHKRNRLTKEPIGYMPATLNIDIGSPGFTLNPTITRTSVIKQIMPFTDELNASRKYDKLCLLGGQLNAYCFCHIGFHSTNEMEGHL